MVLKTIAELYKKVTTGEIVGQLEIVVDGDSTYFYHGPNEDEKGNEIDNEIKIKEANGIYDTEKLYQLLFPDAFIHGP